MSFYDIAKERSESDKAAAYAKELAEMKPRLDAAQQTSDDYAAKMKEISAKIDEIGKPLTDAQLAWKKLNDKFDTQVKVAYTKQWKLARHLP